MYLRTWAFGMYGDLSDVKMYMETERSARRVSAGGHQRVSSCRVPGSLRWSHKLMKLVISRLLLDSFVNDVNAVLWHQPHTLIDDPRLPTRIRSRRVVSCHLCTVQGWIGFRVLEAFTASIFGPTRTPSSCFVRLFRALAIQRS